MISRKGETSVAVAGERKHQQERNSNIRISRRKRGEKQRRIIRREVAVEESRMKEQAAEADECQEKDRVTGEQERIYKTAEQQQGENSISRTSAERKQHKHRQQKRGSRNESTKQRTQ